MDLARMLPLIAALSCPTAPFETDMGAIAAAMAAEPLKPLAWYADAAIEGRFGVTDGTTQTAGGGLGGHARISTWYDAKHYVTVYLEEEWPSPLDFALPPDTSDPLPLMSNQLVRKKSDTTYTVTVGRPTPQEARDFACAANQLLVIARPKPTPAPSEPRRPGPHEPFEVTVTASRPASRCEVWMSDGAYNNYSMSTSRPGYGYDPDLSCQARAELESRAQLATGGPIAETFERRSGKWHPPRVRWLAVDRTDNLYMLLNPGSQRERQIEVRKLTPSGSITRLSARADQPFETVGLIVDGSGRVLATVNENFGAVVFDLASDTHVPVTGAPRGSLNSEAIDAHQTLYATGSSAVYQVSLAGQASQIADLRTGRLEDYGYGRYRIAVAADGKLLLSDATLNVIETLTTEGVVTVLAGSRGAPGANDGAALHASFYEPRGLVAARDGAVFVADTGNHTIRRIGPDGKVSTFAGKVGKRATVDGRGTHARLDSPDSIAIDSTGVLYVTNGSDNLIRKISPQGAVSTLNAQPIVDVQ